jgi:hypothetical protein
MLTIVLSIGPLARLDRRFLPLLYNRRHFGVLTFLVALAHASFMLATYRVRVTRGVVEADPRPLPPGRPAAIRFG